MTERLDPIRLFFDLRQANEIAQEFSGCLEPDEIARRATDGLVEKFDCAFARLWLMEPDQSALKLVASSGMYTNLNGFFGRVPMGAYKVGKIAQNRVSFLSNNLPAEPWVGNREWAIANNICGFAGYPLVMQDRVIGVLAVFSHQAMASEFLEVLQTLCAFVSIAIDTALQYQKEKQLWQASSLAVSNQLPLSDQLATILSAARFTLVGTERSLSPAIEYGFLLAATVFQGFDCAYGRLVYAEDAVSLEAIISAHQADASAQAQLSDLRFVMSCLDGTFETQTSDNQRSTQVILTVPYVQNRRSGTVRIQCRSSILQLAFTRLAYLAGLGVSQDPDVPLLTDDVAQIKSASIVVWIQQEAQSAPKSAQAQVDLSTTPTQLRQAVEAVMQGNVWGVVPAEPQFFSERELEILTLLTQGHRDRDIADRLIISESTVKFHMNNVLAKLKARTRYQAIYQAIVNGWIE